MVYKGPFKEIIFPNVNCEPCAARYRVVLTESGKAVRAIVHLIEGEPTQPHQPEATTLLDLIVARIVAADFHGVRLDRIKVVVQRGSRLISYALGFNALDVRPSGDTGMPRVRSKDEPLHIRSHQIAGGSVAFYVDVDSKKPASARLAALLR
jgi:hypothetical protein